MSELFTIDNAGLKATMISLIVELENATKNYKKPPEEVLFKPQLSSLSISQLQEKLTKLWSKAGTLFCLTNPRFLSRALKETKEIVIKSAFNLPCALGLLKIVGEKIGDLSNFQNCGDFEKVNLIANDVKKIADLLIEILKNSCVKKNEQVFVALFKRINFSEFDYETLYGVLFLLTKMPKINYLPLLNTIFSTKEFIGNKERVVELLNLLTELNKRYFPSEYLDAFCKWVIANPGEKEFSLIRSQMIKIYDNDNKDPILELILIHSVLTYEQVNHIFSMSEDINRNRDKVAKFLLHLIQMQKLASFLEQIFAAKRDVKKKILEILSQAHTLNPVTVEYKELANFLINFNELELLATFCQTTPVSAKSLLTALTQLHSRKPDNFQRFLFEFEKAPYGIRDLENQFSTSEVERVINQSHDLINKTPYTYHYRKQLMVSFRWNRVIL